MINKYFLPTALLLLSGLLWFPHAAVSAGEAGIETALPAAEITATSSAPAPMPDQDKTNAGKYVSIDPDASAAHIRSAPSLAADILRAVPPGYPLEIVVSEGDWIQVKDFMDRKGWISASLLTDPATAIIKVWKGNLRSGPALHEEIIEQLDHGTLLLVVQKNGDWLQVVDPAGLSGWVHGNVAWPPIAGISIQEAADTMKTTAAGDITLPVGMARVISPGIYKKEVAPTGTPLMGENKPAAPVAEEQNPPVANVEKNILMRQRTKQAGSGSESSMPSRTRHTAPSPGGVIELNGHVAVEGRLFFHEPLYPGQERNNASIAMAPEFYYGFDSGSSLTFVPFLRVDSQDSARTHFDIRELNFLYFGDPWELRLGFGKVFWGVTEFVHLVDIINQTDLVEDIRGEDKLGQPMAYLSVPTDLGILDFFVLPYFRERTFPGVKGRLRTSLVVDTDNPLYESSSEENHVDFALRYSRFFDAGDFGIYYFKGTDRQPLFIPSVDANNQPVLLPYYQQIDQVGTDLQLVAGNWLWKLEALYQDNDTQSYAAATGGFEYTFFGLGDSLMDLGLIVEYAYDDRGEEATTPFENDLFFGLRLGANDLAGTEMLLGLDYDLDDQSNVLQLEASRRLSSNIKIFLEGWIFAKIEPEDYYLYSIRNDSFLRLRLFYYF
jgi:SH3-like domain-containing protein